MKMEMADACAPAILLFSLAELRGHGDALGRQITGLSVANRRRALRFHRTLRDEAEIFRARKVELKGNVLAHELRDDRIQLSRRPKILVGVVAAVLSLVLDTVPVGPSHAFGKDLLNLLIVIQIVIIRKEPTQLCPPRMTSRTLN